MAAEVKTVSTFEAALPVALFETHVDNYIIHNRYAVAANGQRFLVNEPFERGGSVPLTVVVNWDAEVKKK